MEGILFIKYTIVEGRSLTVSPTGYHMFDQIIGSFFFEQVIYHDLMPPLK